MSGVDLAALRALAQEATPGPWRDAKTMGAIVSDDPGAIQYRGEDNLCGYGGALVGESIERPDRAFIASCDPQTVLALAEAVEAAQAVEYVFVCRCDEAWTGRVLHDPACLADEGADLVAALAPFRQEHP